MIAYFDTSAIIPLVITEEGSSEAKTHWLAASRVVSVDVTRVEAHSALSRAEREGRVPRADRAKTLGSLARTLQGVTFLEVDAAVVTAAVRVTQATGLRAYDAVHLAAAMSIADRIPLVFVAGDHALLEAASAAGLLTAATP